MKTSQIVARLAEFIIETAQKENVQTVEKLQLAIANWVLDNDITMFKVDDED